MNGRRALEPVKRFGAPMMDQIGPMNFLVVGEWTDPATTGANIAWVRETYAAMARHYTSGRYVNYLNTDDIKERASVAAAFGPNGARLREVKRRYDPDNIFHLNQDIQP